MVGNLPPQPLAILLGDPEPGQVQGHGEELLLALQIDRRIRFDEDRSYRSQVRAVEPGIPGIEIHQHDSPFDVFAIEKGVIPIPTIDHPRRHPSFGQRGCLDQVGPQTVQLDLLAAACHLEEAAFLHRNRDIVLVHRDIIQPYISESLLNEPGRFFGARIAGHPGLLLGEEAQRFPHPLDGHGLTEFGKVDLGIGSRDHPSQQTQQR